MADAPRKRSNVVALTLIGLPIGAITLADAFPPQTYKRNLYPDRAACERDYSPSQCEQRLGGSSGGSFSGSRWTGPSYAASRSSAATGDPGPGRTGQITGTETTTRGGFGAFGRFARGIG